MRTLKPILIIALSSLLGFGCNGAGQDAASGFGFVDDGAGSGTAATEPCVLSGQVPSTEAVRVPALGSASTNFGVTASGTGCVLAWTLNGSALSGTDSIQTLLSSQFGSGANTLEVSATNTAGTVSVSWTVTKNSAPTCGSQTPASTGNAIGVGAHLNLSATVVDADSDTQTFTWTYNGSAAPSLFSGATAGPLVATNQFTPGASQAGSGQIVTLSFTDGYDSGTCSWTVDVASTCGIDTASPSAASVRVAAAGSTSNTFNVTTTGTGCAVSWTLNGSALAGSSTSKSILSSALNSGSNTLVATASNGTSSATRTWTVVKNSPPTCASQSPSSSGNNLGVGVGLPLSATVSDSNSDSQTFTWKFNGSAAPSLFSLQSAGSLNASSTFTPTSSQAGVGQQVTLEFFDGYDTGSCSWSVDIAATCGIDSSTPSPSSVRVPALGSTSNSFGVTPTGTGCAVSWTLNGSALAGTGAVKSVLSSALNTGSNTLVATVSNGTSTVTRTWTVVKNTAPTCGGQLPGSSGNSLIVGASLSLSAIVSDADSDPQTYTWKLNGTTAPALFSSITGAGQSASSVFTPTVSQVGVGQNLSLSFTDGYDSGSCSWTVDVLGPCTIDASSPSGASTRVANAGSTSNSFGVTVGGSGCTVTWALNGTGLPGTGTLKTILSSTFSAGANTLTATASNGTSTATKTWTVTKNTPPVCASQTPASAGTAMVYTNTLALSATVSDADGDSPTFSWKYNGANQPTLFASVGTAGNTGSATFTPTSSQIGASQTITAEFTDGYDSASCSWAVNVRNTCSFTSSLPSSSTVRVASTGSTLNSFGVAVNDGACALSWTLNGSSVGSSSAFVDILSSQFTAGANTLTATASNGSSTATRSWTVTKNSPPTCASQLPSATGNTLAHTTNLSLSGTASDADGDAQTFTWKFNGAAAPALFTSLAGTGMNRTAAFDPGVAQVGNGQTLALEFSDGYETSSCNWAVDITDPNTVSISSCLPASDPVVVTSAGGNSSRTFTVSATGTGLSYLWKLDGSAIGGATSADLTLSSGSLSVGTHTLTAEVRDTYNNLATCDYNLKRNAPPVLSSASPSSSTVRRINYGTTDNFSVSASDANGDTLTYSWKLDGATSATLSSTTSSVTFNPASNTGLVGAHTISLTVSDGQETASQTWNTEVNVFSSSCNSLLNGTVAAQGGKVCTIAGEPSIGNLVDPSVDNTKIRIQPSIATEDASGNVFYADGNSHVIFLHNNSGSTLTRFGVTIPNGKQAVVLGNGAAGQNAESIPGTTFKLDTPLGLAYDDANDILYVADYNNSRVVKLDSSGLATTIIGNTASNNAAGNTDGALGTSHYCGNPAGLGLTTISGVKWLFVACRSGNSIKQMNASPLHVDYGKVWTTVGRFNASTVPIAASGTAGFADGTIGGSGQAVASEPWGLVAAPNGDIYWTERGNGHRVRMATTSTGTASFFGGASSLSSAITMYALDTSATPLTLGSSAVAGQLGGTPTKWAATGPSRVRNNVCTPMIATLQDASSVAAAATGATAISVSATAGTLYSDSGCTSTTTGGTIATGGNKFVFYYKHNVNGSYTINISGASLTATTLSPTVEAAGTESKLVLIAPSTFLYNDCVPVTVQVQTSTSTVATSSANRVLHLSTNGTGTFYSDSSCSTQTVAHTLASGTSEKTLYYSRAIKAPGNSVVTLVAMGGASNALGTSVSSVAEIGVAGANDPRGVTLYTVSGNVRGVFYSNLSGSRINYINLHTSNITFGGTTIEPGDVATVVGTGANGYNGSGILGNLSQINQPYGMGVSSNGAKLYFGDWSNNRVRSLDLSLNNGLVSTVYGSGNLRSGTSTTQVAANSLYLNTPWGLAVDSTNRKLYVADNQNYCIRSVDLLTGYANAAVGRCGNTSGTPTVENEDVLSAYLDGPRGVCVATSASVNYLIYTDSASTTGVNTSSLIRAANLNSTGNGSLMGQTIGAGKVSTIYGSFTLGSNTWTTATANVDGSAGTALRLYNPDHVAFDGNTLFATNYNDHSVVKLSVGSGGSRLIAGTGTSTDGTGAANSRQPRGIYIDPNYAADGNFFFVDNEDQSSGKVRYVNFRTSSLVIGGVTVPAASGGIPYTKTLWNYTPTGTTGRLSAIVAFDTQICYASSWSSGGTGGHNVICRDRTSALGTITLRVGPDETSATTRAGAPVGYEQEGVAASTVLVNGPQGLAFDSDGNLYISERGNHIVRMVRRWW